MNKTAIPAKSSTAPQTDVTRRVIADLEKFPALLPVVLKGLALVESETGTPVQLERVLHADCVMVARILRLANSAYFGVMAEVRTVSMAISIIGYRKLQSLLRHILVSGLCELLSQGRPAATQMRKTAVAASAAAYDLATICDFEDPEELLVAGHLFNIGEMALLWSFPKEYESVLRQTQGKPLGQAQKAAFGTDAGQIGRLVLESWRFPAVFCQAVEHWPDPMSESADPSLRRFFSVLHVGVTVARAWEAETAPESLEISPQILAELQVQEEVPRQALAHLPQKIAEVQATLED